MTLTSLPFVVFLCVVLAIFNLVPERHRWLVLLLSSYLFYAFLKLPYLLLALAAVTAVSYFSALRIEGEGSPGKKRWWLWGGIFLNLAPLVGLKYVPFVIENLNAIMALTSSGQKINGFGILTSIGVSYFVFQGISYIADVYLDQLAPERHPGRFALYIAFFPKLLQGPIERGERVLPQLQSLSRSQARNLYSGGNLFVWGLFKKVVVADHLATLVDPVYGDLGAHTGISLLMATYMFAFQLYFDFSGYTDMALGAARCFNINLTRNFRTPYLATSIADFWRRWHISFSSWILDYIFRPLQFSFRQWRQLGTQLALLITFLASGIWHGASWCFIAWGAVHGCYMAFATLVTAKKQKLYKKMNIGKNNRLLKLAQIFTTFHLVCLGWVFFRAKSLGDAFLLLERLFLDLSSFATLREQVLHYQPAEGLAFALFLLAFTGTVAIIGHASGDGGNSDGAIGFIDRVPLVARGAVYGVLAYMILLCGAQSQSFIYLQF